jgi:hypothetical protein
VTSGVGAKWPPVSIERQDVGRSRAAAGGIAAIFAVFGCQSLLVTSDA